MACRSQCVHTVTSTSLRSPERQTLATQQHPAVAVHQCHAHASALIWAWPSLRQPWQWRCHKATLASAKRSRGRPRQKPGKAGSGGATVERLCMTSASPSPNTPVVGR